MNKEDEENFDVYLQMQEQKLAEYDKSLNRHMASDSVNDQSMYSSQDLRKYNYRMVEYESNEQEVAMKREEAKLNYKKKVILTGIFTVAALVIGGVVYFGWIAD